MNLTETEPQILEGVRGLSPKERALVLSYIEGLRAQSQGILTEETILSLAGILSDEDAEQMRRAIEEGCERIDWDGW